MVFETPNMYASLLSLTSNSDQEKKKTKKKKRLEFLLLQCITWRHAGQVAILIVIYNPKLGQAKTTSLICIPSAAEELLVRDDRRSSRASKRNSAAGVHIKPEQVSRMSGKSLSN